MPQFEQPPILHSTRDTAGHDRPSQWIAHTIRHAETQRTPDEGSIVERIKSGERELFFDLVRPHLTILRRYLRSLACNSFDMEDVLQQTLLQAYISLHQLRSAQLFRPWLFRIAVNEMRKFRRQNRSDYLLSSIDEPLLRDEEGVPTSRDIPDRRDTPAETWARQELAMRLRAEIEKLPVHWQKLLLLHDAENISIPRLAKTLGMDERAAKTNLHRARFQLRQLLTGNEWSSRGLTSPSARR
jgi:RNA polymerase sigma-70 factor, ECF subfamily